jgi:hypothetical protein
LTGGTGKVLSLWRLVWYDITLRGFEEAGTVNGVLLTLSYVRIRVM